MDYITCIPRIAHLLADAARATMLWTLVDGTMRPAGELAHAANISAQSASAHLAKLVEGGFLSSEAQGRHRYFRIASPEVADAMESFASLSAQRSALALGAGVVSPRPHLLRPPRGREGSQGPGGDAEGALARRRRARLRRDAPGREEARGARGRSGRGARVAARVRARLRGPDPAALALGRSAGRGAARRIRREDLDPARTALARREHHPQRAGSLSQTVRRVKVRKMSIRGGTDPAPQLLDLAAPRLAFEALSLRAPGRPGRPALARNDGRTRDELVQPGERLFAVALEAAVLLRLDDENALAGDALVA